MFPQEECIRDLQGKKKKVEISLVSAVYPQNRTEVYALAMHTLALLKCLIFVNKRYIK